MVHRVLVYFFTYVSICKNVLEANLRTLRCPTSEVPGRAVTQSSNLTHPSTKQ